MRRRVRRWLAIGTIIVIVGAILILPRIIGDALYPIKYEDEVRAAALEFGVEEALIFAVIRSESNFRPNVSSHAGATGLMQLIPSTGAYVARTIGLTSFTAADLYDPAINVRLGTAYLKALLDQYGGDEQLALAAYNGGPGTANSFLRGGTLPRETSRYVPIVLDRKEKYAEILAEREQEAAGANIGENPEELSGIRKAFSHWFK